jgi:hypothetical protein
MRLTFLAAALVALTMTACGKPNQALPEQEKDNFAKITSQPAKPADSSAPASGESSDGAANPGDNAPADAAPK